jgi:DnaK suppressor protein
MRRLLTVEEAAAPSFTPQVSARTGNSVDLGDVHRLRRGRNTSATPGRQIMTVPAGSTPTARPAAAGPDGPDSPAGKFLVGQRQRLVAQRAIIVAKVIELEDGLAQLRDAWEPAEVEFAEEGSEGATLSVERDRDRALRNRLLAAVAAIDAALARLDARTYGICEGCGMPIPEARLEVVPEATWCVPCKAGGLLRRR